MAADTIIRVQFITNAEQAISGVNGVRNAVQQLNGQRARVGVDADFEKARRDLADFRNETARLRAEKLKIPIEVDVQDAQRDIRAINLETQKINATVARFKIEADTTQVNAEMQQVERQIVEMQNSAARFRAQKIGIQIDTNVDQTKRDFAEIEQETRKLNATIALARAQQQPQTVQENPAVTQLRKDAAEIENTTARLRAQRVGINITADTTGLQRGVEETRAETQKINAMVAHVRVQTDTGGIKETESALTSLIDKVQNVAAYSAGYQAFRLFENAVGGAARTMIEFNARLEQSRVAFTTALGSQGQADQFITQLEEFAKVTPFQFPDLTKYAQQLLGMGIAAKDVIPDLTALGNAVSGVGGDSALLERIVHAFGEIQSSGKAAAFELREMTRAGIPAYQFLAKTLNTDVAGAMAAVTKGVVDSQTAIDSLTTGMNERFGGLMDAQSKTFLGRLSNLRDSFEQQMGAVGKPLFDELSKALSQVAKAVDSSQFRDVMGDLVTQVEAFLSAAMKIMDFFTHIPAGVIEFGIRLAEISAGMAAIARVTDFLVSGLTKTAAALVAETALYKADTIAVEENTIAKQRASGIQLEGALGSRIQQGVNVTSGAVRTGLATVATTAAAIIQPVSALATVTFIGASIADQIEQHLERENARAQDAADRKTLRLGVDAALSVSGVQGVQAYYDALGRQLDELTQAQRVFLEDQRTGLAGFGALNDKIAAAIGQNADKIKQAQAQVAPEVLERQAVTGFQGFVEQVNKAISRGQSEEEIKKAAESGKAALAGMKQSFLDAHGSIETFNQSLSDATDEIDKNTASTLRNLVQRQQQIEAMQQQAAEIFQHAGEVGLAPPADVMAGLEGTDKASADQIKLIKERYDAMKKAQDDAQKEILQRENQFQQELDRAASRAVSAVSAINLDQGLPDLARAAKNVDLAKQALDGLGRSSAALDNIAKITDQFKALADAEESASDAFKGYLSLFDETDRRIKILDDLKKKLDDQVKAAREAQKEGTITPDQQQLLAHASDAYANIAASREKLVQHQTGDLIGALGNVPDLERADTAMRDLVAAAGGGKQIRLDIRTNMQSVQDEMDTILNPPRDLTLKPIIDVASLPDWLKPAFANPPSPAQLPVDLNPAGLPGGVPWMPGVPSAGGDGGYVRPRSTAVTGGGPYGTGTTYQPGGGGGTPSLTFARWNEIIQQGTFTGSGALISPLLNNLQAFKDFTRAIQSSGLDPYIALAAMQQESAFGTNPLGAGTANARVNNYIGMGINTRQWGRRGGSGVAASDYGPGNYASYASLYEQTMDLAAWLQETNPNATTIPSLFRTYSTDPGASTQKASIYRQISGNAAPSGQAQQIANTVGDQIVQEALKSLNVDKLAGWCEQFVEDTVQAITGQRPTDPQSGAPPRTAARALEVLQGQGRGVSSAQAQPGDLVYYGASSGSPEGHVAIYMGGGKQIGTADVSGTGVHIGPVAAGAQFIRPPGVVGGPTAWYGPGTYTSTGGTGAVPAWYGPGTYTSTGGTGAGTGVNELDPNTPAAQAARAQLLHDQQAAAEALARLVIAQHAYNDALTNVDPRNVTEVRQQYQTLTSIMDKAEKAKIGPDATEVQKTEATVTAMTKATEATTLWAQGITTINQQTGQLEGIEDRIAKSLDPAIASSLNDQLEAMRAQKETADDIASLQKEKVAVEQQWTATQQQQQDADRQRQRDQQLQQRADQAHDTQRQRSQTLEQRGIQDQRTATQRQWQDEQYINQERDRQRNLAHEYETRRIQDETNAENNAWTTRSRQLQDQQRDLQHFGTTRKQQLVDEQKAREDANRDATNARNAQVQLASANVRVAGTNEQALQAGMVLASLKDAQATADELFKTQTDANKKLQDTEDKTTAEQLYQLETQTLAETRAHEDRLNAITVESTAQDRAFQDESNRIAQQDQAVSRSHELQQRLWQDEDTARQRASEDEQFNIQQQRTARNDAWQDEQYNIETERIAQSRAHDETVKTIDAEIAARQEIAKQEADRLKAAQDALTAWTQTDDLVTQAAATLADALGALPYTGDLPKKAVGGVVHGSAIVGDSPYGDLSSAEVVTGDFTVIPHGEAVARGLIPGNALARYVNGTGTNSGGDTYNIDFNASGNRVTDEAMFARLTTWIVARDRAKEIEIRRTSMNARNAAEGGGRY
jgi:tape measure domain-containing protein